MPFIHIEKTAAEAALGADLFEKEPFAKGANYWRIIKKIAYTGSTAAGDTKIDVKVGNTIIVDDLPNSKTGLLEDTLAGMINVNRKIPPSTPIQCIVVDAALTNPVHIYIQIDASPRKKRTYRRTYSRRYTRRY